jgi:hypothetical protein
MPNEPRSLQKNWTMFIIHSNVQNWYSHHGLVLINKAYLTIRFPIGRCDTKIFRATCAPDENCRFSEVWNFRSKSPLAHQRNCTSGQHSWTLSERCEFVLCTTWSVIISECHMEYRVEWDVLTSIADLNHSLQWMRDRTCSDEDFIRITDSFKIYRALQQM